MRSAIAWVVCIALGPCVWLAWSSRAEACTCLTRRELRQRPASERKQPDVVFVGRLIATEEILEAPLAERDPKLLEGDWNDEMRKEIVSPWVSGLRHRFRVTAPLRGVRGRRELVIESKPGHCGFHGEPRALYRIRAWRDAEGRLATGLCGGNRAVWPTAKMHRRRRSERSRH